MTLGQKLTEYREKQEAKREAERAESKAAHLRELCIPSRTLHSPTYEGGVSGEGVEKENPLRSEAYRRLVAAKPCKYCGREEHSQAAHPPPEGKSLKHDDRLCFPLCADDLGRKGCHPRFDQYDLFPHYIALQWARKWAAETRAEIKADGEWPKGLEMFDEVMA